MGRALKIIRVAVEAILLGLLTYTLVRCSVSQGPVGALLVKIQFIPAALSFSLSIIISWLIVTLIFGRIYCSTVCPLGAVQDAAARLSATLQGRKWKGYTYGRPFNLLRYVTLGIVFFMLVTSLTAMLLILDPFTIYEYSLAAVTTRQPALLTAPVKIAAAASAGYMISFAALVAIAAVAARSGRTFCNTLCPAGTTLSFVARYSIFHIDINPDKCIQCRRCERVCKARCIDVPAHTVDASRCVVCFNCVTGCPNDAIRYTSSRHHLSYPLMQSIDGAVASMTGADAKTQSITSIHKSAENEDLSQPS